MYKLQEDGVKRLSDSAWIPPTISNRDWVEYQKWLADGNSPEPEFTQEELDTKVVEEEKAAQELKIQKMIREIAINQLIADGELPVDYKERQ